MTLALRLLAALWKPIALFLGLFLARRDAVADDRTKRALQASKDRIDTIQEAARERAKAEAMDADDLARSITRR